MAKLGVDRRSLLRLSGGTVAFIVGDQLAFSPASLADTPEAAAAARLAARLPKLDGVFVFDIWVRRAMAADWGRSVHRLPRGVLLPKSVEDVRRIVRFASDEGLKVAMRGHGCSTYGQAQTDGGVVIDTADMNQLTWASPTEIDCQPGVTWFDALHAAQAKGLTPPVTPDALYLTIGGALSAGGVSLTSYNRGACVDHVAELDVVTGTGELITCSADRHADLFDAVLAGMGQCGLIVRARLKLAPAPRSVAVRRLRYQDRGSFVADMERYAQSVENGGVYGRLVRQPDGFRPEVVYTNWFYGAEDPSAAPWLSSMAGRPEGAARITSFDAYVDMITQRDATQLQNDGTQSPRPRVHAFVARSAVNPTLDFLATDPDAALGVNELPVLPLRTAAFKRPMFRLPEGEIAFNVRLYRIASAEGAEDHVRMLKINTDTIIPRVLKDGGTFYPPHSPVLAPDQWRAHFGPLAFGALRRARAKYDPLGLLTPGAGIFAT